MSREFSLAVWSRERNCVVCGEPGSNAHHVYFKGQGGEDVLENGVMLCGTGTMGCHGLMTNMDEETREAIGAYIVRSRPDTLRYLTRTLGGGGMAEFMRRVYRTEVVMSAPQPGHVDAAKVELYTDEVGEFRWQARDTNGEIVADSGDDGYVERSYAEKAARDLFPNAEIVWSA